MGEDPKIKRRLLLGLLPVALAVLLLLCLRLFGEEKESSPLPEETSPSSTVTPDPSPGMETPTPGPVPVDADAGKVRIAELMVKNRATLVDEDGEFPDWIELENISEDSVELTGWRLTDSEKKPGWTFPETRLDPGERLLLFADRKDGALHTGFSLSAGETLLRFPEGELPAGLSLSAGVELGVRPNDIVFDPESPIKVKVNRCTFLGSEYDYRVTLGTRELRVQQSALDAMQRGTVKAGETTGVRLVNPRYYPAKKEAQSA